MPFIPPCAGQQVDPAFEFDPNVALQWIPMSDIAAPGIIIPVVVNGRKVNAMIDTGSIGPQSTTISKNLQAELKLASNSSGRAIAYGGPIDTEISSLKSLRIGGVTLWNPQVDVAPEQDIWSDGVDLIVGHRIMLGLLLQVDWTKRQVRLLLTGDLPATADDIPVGVEDGIGNITVPVQFCGAHYQFILDTGADSDTLINPGEVSLENCGEMNRSDRSSSGLGGKLVREIVATPRIRLGGRPFPDIIAGVEAPGDPLARKRRAGSVGTGLLRRSNFVLDVGAGQLRFYGPDRSAKVIDRPTLGIQFRKAANALTIVHIMSNSPASQTSLQIGDRICRLNGKTLDELRGDISAINPPAGAATEIGLCDGRAVAITSRDFMASAASTGPISRAAPTTNIDGLGHITEALARCGGKPGLAAIDGCGMVIASATIPVDYRVSARVTRAQLYESLQRPDDALADVNALIGEHGASSILLAMRAQYNLKLKRYDHTARDIEKALEINSSDPIAYLVRAHFEYEMKQYGRGIEAANQALSLAPGDYQALNALALGYYHQGRLEAALAEVGRAIAARADYAEAFVTRGQIWENMGRVDPARKDFERALQIDPVNADAESGRRRVSFPNKKGN
jgi:Flp pilus assembly protein TadD